MRVNFSVTNQLATPSIHAAALANRPPAGQPGRLFVDTDNPSSGIYRDTGTVWENITGGAGAGNLQTVTDAGNTTTNNILLNYDNSTQANALVFYNVDAAQEEYLIEKRGTGITTNDSLVIQSRGNISPSTNPAGIMIDGANDVIKTFYTTAYTEQGLKLDFANNVYQLGTISNLTGVIVNESANTVKLGDADFAYTNGTGLIIDNSNSQIIHTTNQGNDIGLKLDFANQRFYLGDYNYVGSGNGISFVLFDDTATSDYIIKSTFQGNDIGLKLDFANYIYSLGDLVNNIGAKVDIGNGEYFFGNYGAGSFLYSIGYQIFIGDCLSASNGTYLSIDDNNQRLEVSGNLASGTAGGSSGQHLKIRVGGVDYKIALLNP